MMYLFKTHTQHHRFDRFFQAPGSSNITITSHHQPPPHDHRSTGKRTRLGHKNTSPRTQRHGSGEVGGDEKDEGGDGLWCLSP